MLLNEIEQFARVTERSDGAAGFQRSHGATSRSDRVARPLAIRGHDVNNAMNFSLRLLQQAVVQPETG